MSGLGVTGSLFTRLLEAQIDRLTSKFLDTRVSKVEKKVKKMQQAQKELNTAIDEINASLKTLTEGQARMEGKLDVLAGAKDSADTAKEYVIRHEAGQTASKAWLPRVATYFLVTTVVTGAAIQIIDYASEKFFSEEPQSAVVTDIDSPETQSPVNDKPVEPDQTGTEELQGKPKK